MNISNQFFFLALGVLMHRAMHSIVTQSNKSEWNIASKMINIQYKIPIYELYRIVCVNIIYLFFDTNTKRSEFLVVFFSSKLKWVQTKIVQREEKKTVAEIPELTIRPNYRHSYIFICVIDLVLWRYFIIVERLICLVNQNYKHLNSGFYFMITVNGQLLPKKTNLFKLSLSC